MSSLEKEADKKIRKYLLKIHMNLSHPGPDSFVRFLSYCSKASAETVRMA